MNNAAVNRFIVLIVSVLIMVISLLAPRGTMAVTIDDLFGRYYQNNSISVLCYHDIYPTNNFEDELGVSVQNLERHLQYLQNNGYNVITLDQYINYIEAKEEVVRSAQDYIAFL